MLYNLFIFLIALSILFRLTNLKNYLNKLIFLCATCVYLSIRTKLTFIKYLYREQISYATKRWNITRDTHLFGFPDASEHREMYWERERQHFTCSRSAISETPRVHVTARGAATSRDFRRGKKQSSISGRDTRTNGTRLFITTMHRASTANRAFTITPYFIGQI